MDALWNCIVRAAGENTGHLSTLNFRQCFLFVCFCYEYVPNSAWDILILENTFTAYPKLRLTRSSLFLLVKSGNPPWSAWASGEDLDDLSA